MLTLTKIDPKVKEQIQSIVELNEHKMYLLELSWDLSKAQFAEIAKSVKECFNNAGLKCMIAPKGMIENIYELEEGD